MNRASFAVASWLLLAGTLLAAPPGTTPSLDKGVSERGSFFSGTLTKKVTREQAPAPRAVVKPSLPSINDILEVVVFTPQRPVRVRVHIVSQGKRLSEIWNEKLRKMFDFFDRDKDSFLSANECRIFFGYRPHDDASERHISPPPRIVPRSDDSTSTAISVFH